MQMNEYKPGDIVPETSSFYRVVHDPPGQGEQLETFLHGEHFPRCLECGTKVRYVLSKFREKVLYKFREKEG